MIYLEVGTLILVIALISVSDLIYRRLSKAGHPRRRRSGERPVAGSRFAGLSSRVQKPRFGRPRTASPAAASSSSPEGASGPIEFVRVKLRSGRIVEGWRAAGEPTTSGGLDDAFDLDVSKAFDPNGNPMSFPSDSFIVFSSQVERLDVLDATAGRKSDVAAPREGTLGIVTASIAPSPTEVPDPESQVGADDSEERAAAYASEEGLGQVIQMPELEEVHDTAPATLVPAPDPARERPLRHVNRPTPIPTRAPETEAPRPRRTTRARPLRWIGAVAALLVIALIADGLFTFFSLSHALDSTRGDLRRGSSALLAGHYQAAHAEFLKAVSASGTADQLQGHPAFWVSTQLPWLNRDPLALAALGRSSDLASQAGLDAVQAVRAMGSPSEGLAAAVYSDGQINLNASQRGEPFFVDIEDLLGRAYTTLRAAPPPVFSPVQDALTLAATKIAQAKDAIHKTRSLVQALPSLFGRDQTRYYLLLFDNPSIARGSGGPVDFFGILKAKAGSLTVGRIRPIDNLATARAPASLAPDWFRKAYGPSGALGSWEELTRSPSFDVVAPIAQNLYESATGTKINGVVQMDPVALGLMTKAVGSIRQPPFDVAVNSNNAVQVLTHDVYVHFGTDELGRDQYVAGLLEEVWKRVSRGDATAPELATALGDASGGSHFTMYSSNKSDERALDQVGIGAAFSTSEPNVQMALTNNQTFSRIGYYERRKISTVARLTRTGKAFVTTTVTLVNSAPTGPARILVRNLQSGQDRSDLGLVLPEHAHVQGVSMGGKTQRYDVGFEGTNPRVVLPVSIGAGKTVRVAFSYLIPHAVSLKTSGGLFRFGTVPQATANPDETSVTVVPPDGFNVVESGSVGGSMVADSYVASDTAGGPLKLVVKLAPPP